MIEEKIIVANLKCTGCATTITHDLLKINGVKHVDVILEENTVDITYENDLTRKEIIDKLYTLGYPEATEENGLLLQMKSYASCMIGRMNNMSKIED
jgi:copper chaperone CopZ